MEVAVRVVCGIVGVALVAVVLDSALRTFVVPRGIAQPYTRAVMVAVRRVFEIGVRRAHTYEGRDRVMALYGPVTLLLLPLTWMVVVGAAFTLLYRAAGVATWRIAFEASGSSLLTLGFQRPSESYPILTVSFAEALLGLALLALLIAFLPTIYGVYSRREVLVTQSDTRAGSPPDPVQFIVRAHSIGWLDQLDDHWVAWQVWFAELDETHTSFAILPFFRSSAPDRSWITTAGATLDAAALLDAAVDTPPQPNARLCIRAGTLALRSIGAYYEVPFDPDPRPGDPISVTRDEFDGALDALARSGVPLRADREQAWRDFAGWRVNYDAVLVPIAGLVMAPYAPWVSDRSTTYRGPRLRRSGGARATRRSAPPR